MSFFLYLCTCVPVLVLVSDKFSLYLYLVDPPAFASCQPNFGSEIKALCKSAKNNPRNHKTSYVPTIKS